MWHGYTTPENAGTYEQLLQTEISAEFASKQIEGYKGIQLLRRDLNNEVEFVTLITFTNYEAVKQFAGENYEEAHIPDAARKVLSRYHTKVQHYEIIE